MRRESSLSLCFLLLFTLSGWGQTLTGTILGTITDPTGAVLPGVEVTITNVATNRERVVLTGGSGTYSAPNLPVSCPRTSIVPARCRLSPMIVFSSTDLPVPDPPTMPITSPRVTSRSSPS